MRTVSLKETDFYAHHRLISTRVSLKIFFDHQSLMYNSIGSEPTLLLQTIDTLWYQ